MIQVLNTIALVRCASSNVWWRQWTPDLLSLTSTVSRETVILQVEPDKTNVGHKSLIDLQSFVSSVRSSSGYHGLLHIRSTHFFKFFKFFRFESESERTQHVLYFWKAWDSRISKMTFPCIKCKIHKYTITQIHKNKVLKIPYMCYIF